MNLGFAGHLFLAGAAMYAFLRALRVGWTGAVVGGLAYQLTGIVASLVKPGHDGKMFVSALAPLAFLALLRAVRDRRESGYGLLALTVGLCMLSPHYQMTYYLLVAAGLWTLWLALLDPERPRERKPYLPIALAFGAVVLGVAHRGDPGHPVPRVHPVLAPRRRRPERRLGVRHRVLDAPRGAAHHRAPPVQRRARRLLGPELLQAAHRVSRRYGGAARRAGVGRSRAAAAPRRDRGDRRALPAGVVRRTHAVLPGVVRDHAHDEEGARPRHGLLSGGALRGRVGRRSAPTGWHAAR